MVRRSVNRVLRHLNRAYFTRGFQREYNHSGIDVMARDWDILVLLDGCRADVFERISSREGEYERVESRGAMTREFLWGNFHGEKYLDTVYVTANPMYRRHQDSLGESFHDVVNVWKEDGWDEKHDTVLPETTANFGVRIGKKHPNKRLIIHFMQPHYPFLSNEFDFQTSAPDPKGDEPGFWMKIRNGTISIDKESLLKAYEHNLSRVLSRIEKIIEELEGKIVVTSDHGNLFGERIRPFPIVEWGHPHALYVRELVTVPWLEIRTAERRQIVPGDRSNEHTNSTDKTEQRLRQLGYMN